MRAGTSQTLVDLLADPSPEVRSSAAKVIWAESNVTFAIRCLRDMIEGTALSPAAYSITPEQAQRGLELLRDVRPDRRGDFEQALAEAWPPSDTEAAV